MELLLKHLGSFSATTHNIPALAALGVQPEKGSPAEVGNEDDLLGEVAPPENEQTDLDLFDIDVPVSSGPPESQPAPRNEDLFDIDIAPTGIPRLQPGLAPA